MGGAGGVSGSGDEGSGGPVWEQMRQPAWVRAINATGSVMRRVRIREVAQTTSSVSGCRTAREAAEEPRISLPMRLVPALVSLCDPDDSGVVRATSPPHADAKKGRRPRNSVWRRRVGAFYL